MYIRTHCLAPWYIDLSAALISLQEHGLKRPQIPARQQNEAYTYIHRLTSQSYNNITVGSEIPAYDEDLDEGFAGPFSPHELEDLEEAWDDEYEEESTRLLASGGINPLPESPQSSPGGGSAFTQLGAAPGIARLEEALPGYRDFEPGRPPMSGAAEFAASSGDGNWAGQAII